MNDQPNTTAYESSFKWLGSVTPEMIAAGRAAALKAPNLQIEAMYRAMRALEEDADVRI